MITIINIYKNRRIKVMESNETPLENQEKEEKGLEKGMVDGWRLIISEKDLEKIRAEKN